MKLNKFFGFTILFLFFACGKEEKQNEKKVFRMNLDEGLASLDPAFARDQRSTWMTSQLFNGLVSLDSNMQVIPDIAKRWEILEEGKLYRFFLRRGVFFHQNSAFGKDSTRQVVAQDFVYSFTRICDTATASTGAWIFNQSVQGIAEFLAQKSSGISGFYAPNDSVFELRLNAAFAPFLGLLAMPYGYVLPKEGVDYYGKNFGRNPIGTGAFQLFDWKENNYLILHKNPHYFEAHLPYLGAVYVQFIASRLSAFVAFTQGKLDLINKIDNSYKDELLSSKGEIQNAYQKNFRFYRNPLCITFYVGLRNDARITGNILVRKALSYAIDREALVKYLLNGNAYPAKAGFVPQNAAGFDAKQVKGGFYLPDSARFLWQKYLSTHPDTVFVLHTAPQYAAIAEFIQKEWEKVGIKVQVNVVQGGALRKDIYAGKCDMWMANWIGDYPDAETHLALLFSKNFAPKGPNTTHYHNDIYDNLYKKSLSETQDSLRYNLYHQMENLYLQDFPLIPLYYGRNLWITPDNISGIETNALNVLVLKKVRKQ